MLCVVCDQVTGDFVSLLTLKLLCVMHSYLDFLKADNL